jgi:hypothetical protein
MRTGLLSETAGADACLSFAQTAQEVTCFRYPWWASIYCLNTSVITAVEVAKILFCLAGGTPTSIGTDTTVFSINFS